MSVGVRKGGEACKAPDWRPEVGKGCPSVFSKGFFKPPHLPCVHLPVLSHNLTHYEAWTPKLDTTTVLLLM